MSDFIAHPVRHLPGGKKRPLLIMGLVGGGAAIFIYERRKSAANAAAAVTDPNATDPNADPNAVDPNAVDYASSNGYGDYSPALSSYTDPGTGAIISGAGYGQTILAPTTNAQWVQQALAALTAAGYNPVTVTAALGHYIAGNPSSSDMSIVQAAIAIEGNPPNPPIFHITTPSKDTTAPPAPGNIRVVKAGVPNTKYIQYTIGAHTTGVQLLTSRGMWLETQQYSLAGQTHHFLVPAHSKFYLQSLNGAVKGGRTSVITT